MIDKIKLKMYALYNELVKLEKILVERSIFGHSRHLEK
jgi:hypothetical protein